jgi:peptidoglycan/xylan/chitin deacetylase (PgdA/CDA1 family)
MKAVMYHYIREFDYEFPYFKYLHVDDFRKQLDYFDQKYGFVSKCDFIKSLETGVFKPGVILTFDDAFKDHYSYVFPELKKRGLWGIFYVPTSPYVDSKILDVHKVHLLLGKFGGSAILELLTEFVDSSMLSHNEVGDYQKMTYQTQLNDENKDAVSVKRILNYFVSYKYRSSLINRLMSVLFENEQDILKNFYLSLDEISQMSSSGMMFGSHTVSHPVLSKLDNEQQRIEIEESFSFLNENIQGITHQTFCYPHGGFHTFTDFTETVLCENEVCFSFNVEPRDINTNDLLDRPQALPRYDCNLFPYGSIRKTD